MRVLFVTEFVPLPLNTGGRIRTFHILKQAASRHLVTVITHGAPDEAKSLMDKTGARVIGIPYPKCGRMRRVLGALTSLADDRPYAVVGAHDDSQLRKALAQVVSREEFDLVHLDHLDAAVYAPVLKRIPMLLDEHNFETRLLKRAASKTKNPILRWYLQGQAERLLHWEANICGACSIVTAVSKEDAKEIIKVSPNSQVHVVPNGVDTDFFHMEDRNPQPSSLVFVGSMDWIANVDAIEWFVGEILPLLPNAHLTIVGRNPSLKVVRLADGKRVTVTGSVPDVRPYMARAEVFVVPLRVGGGTRLKILEAFSVGIPVVSTAVGAEGLGVRHEEEILLGENAEAFATNIRRIQNSPDLAMRLIQQAKILSTRFSWDSVGSQLEDAYAEVVLNRQIEKDIPVSGRMAFSV